MNVPENETSKLFPRIGNRSVLAKRACATALTLTLCCAPLVPLSAAADDDSSDASSSSSAAVPADEGIEPETPSSDDGSSGGDEGTAGENESGGEGTSPESGGAPDEEASADEASDSDAPEDDGADSDDESSSSSPKAEDRGSSSSSSASKSSKDRPATQSKETRKRKTKAEEAVDKREQAEAIYGQMRALQANLDKYQAEYDRAKRAYDKTVSLRKEKRAALDEAEKGLASLREELSKYVVDMYKQGGVAPYLDVLLRATTYEEFISAWYLLDEVSFYGKDEIHEQVEAVKALEAELDTVKKQVKKAKEKMERALPKLGRAKLTVLSLAPHAAKLKMDAAELSGDSSAYEAAKAEYDEASAALEEALEDGLDYDVKLKGEGIFTHPCPDATYSSGFGYRTFDHAYHLGLDMAISEGTPYYAADSGTVTASTNGGGYNGGAGNWIVIDHGNGLVTKYMHSLVTFVEPGDHVVRGQNIGLVGNTGDSYGAHLHFQVEINGTAVDPLIYL